MLDKFAEELKNLDLRELPKEPERTVREKIRLLKERKKGIRASVLRTEMQNSMRDYCSVFRNKGLNTALDKIRSLRDQYNNVRIDNKGNRFNTDLIEALELEFLLQLSETVLVSALARTESRGAHFREDYEERDDINWLKHGMVKKTEAGPQLFSRPVSITRFEPKPRTY